MTKITYGDIPSRDTCFKLSMVSFDSPSKNLRVYKFCEALRVCQNFFENERHKLMEKYGTEESPGKYKVETVPYNTGIKNLIALEIDDEIPDHGLTENDFSDDMCQYPTDKNLWLNAAEIRTILAFGEKIKENG